MKMCKCLLFVVIVLFYFVLGCSQKKDGKVTIERYGPIHKLSTEGGQDVARQLSRELEKRKLYKFSTVILMIFPESVIKAKKMILDKGGKIIYDPNLGKNGSHKFLIVELAPELIDDLEFVTELSLFRATIFSNGLEEPKHLDADNNKKLKKDEVAISDFSKNNAFVPIENIGLKELREKVKRNSSGEDIIVGIVDSGVDASHPAFGDRVIFWKDSAGRTKTSLVEVTPEDNDKKDEKIIKFPGKEDGEEERQMLLPTSLCSGKKFYLGVMDEEKINYISKRKSGFLDVNRDGSADEFLVLVVRGENDQLRGYFDIDGDLELSIKEVNHPLTDFNDYRQSPVPETFPMVDFNYRRGNLKYPFLLNLNKEGDPETVEIGFLRNGHGTHVAGIVGGNDKNFKGVAPNVKIMAANLDFKHSTTVKAIISLFYNRQGLVPDVVNLSIGGKGDNEISDLGYLFQDLSSKFGTVFVIASGNSGPGYNTSSNWPGNFGSVIHVGASISNEFISKRYIFNEGKQKSGDDIFYFSTSGPRFSGAFDPNIVAPGAAISSTESFSGGIDLYNGTSMAAPVATGAIAAMLSTLKKQNPEYFKVIKRNREIILNNDIDNDADTGINLNNYVSAVKESLEQTATPLLGVSTIRQGHGQIHVERATGFLSKRLEQLNRSDNVIYPIIKTYGKKTFYNRASTEIKRYASVKISTFDNGEISNSERNKIKVAPVKVFIEKVEIVDSNGMVKRFDGDKQNFIKFLGTNKGSNSSVNILLVDNSNQDMFRLERNLKSYEAGKTYITHIKMMIGERTIHNFLDVVHKPVRFEKKKITLAEFDVTNKYVQNGFEKSEMTIPPGKVHRYFIAAEKFDKKIEVRLNLDNVEDIQKMGIFFYNPEGYKMAFDYVWNYPADSNKRRFVSFNVDVSDKDSKGIWELCLYNYNLSLMSDTKYGLVIFKEKKGVVSKKRIELDLSKEKKVRSFISVTNLDDDDKINTSLGKLIKVIPMNDVEISPGMWTFVSLDFSNIWKTEVKKKKILFSILRNKKSENVYMKLFSSLYFKNDKDEFEVMDYGDKDTDWMKKVSEIDGKVYAGMETYYINYSFFTEKPMVDFYVFTNAVESEIKVKVTPVKIVNEQMVLEIVATKSLQSPRHGRAHCGLKIEINGRPTLIPIDIEF